MEFGLRIDDSLEIHFARSGYLRMTKRTPLAAAALGLLFAAVPGSADDVTSLMQQCNDCHGEQGISQDSDVPTIAGLAEFVHADALYIYRDRERPCTDSNYRHGDTGRAPTNMCDVAAALSDDQIDAIAAAYAALPFVPAKQDFDASLVARGTELHQQSCDRCHSRGGTDPEDEAGILGGQRMDYLRNAFSEYAAGSREQPEKMQQALAKLSPADIEALLNYYASLQ